MDIKRAIQEEEFYLIDTLYLNKDTSLIERLNSYGYTSLETYFEDKRLYQLSILDYSIFYGDGKPALTQAIENLHKKKPYFTIASMPKTTIVHGMDGGINYEICDELGIEIIESNSPGGTIICQPGDQQHAIVVPKSIDINRSWFLNKIANFCRRYYDNVVVDVNDILINGKKVVPSSSVSTDDMFFFIFQMSFIDSSELVKKICTKGGPKEVGYVDKFTPLELAKEVKSWLQVQ